MSAFVEAGQAMNTSVDSPVAPTVVGVVHAGMRACGVAEDGTYGRAGGRDAFDRLLAGIIFGDIRGAGRRPLRLSRHAATLELRPFRSQHMRFIHLFLIGYFLLAFGVGLALWQTGVLDRIAPVWIGIGALIVVGLGIMLSVSSGKPTVTEEMEK
jgi:hypothetical protein